MTQECCMIIVDNSDSARNGDCLPSRFQAQIETVNTLVRTKLNQNPQNTVGLMTMGNSQCQVLTTPVNNSSQIYSKYNQIQIGGKNSFFNALQVAQLVLKHWLEKKQAERIIILVASEINENENALIQLAKSFKKSQINLDIINICCDQNIKILQQINEIVNVDNESTFLNYQPGPVLLQNQVQGSGILGSQNQQGMVIEGQDDYMDEELQMILRISLEEEQKRLQQQQEKEQQEKDQKQKENSQQQDNNNQQQNINQDQQKLDELIKEQQKAVQKQESLKDPQFLKEIMKDLDLDKNQSKDQQNKKDQNDKKDTQ